MTVHFDSPNLHTTRKMTTTTTYTNYTIHPLTHPDLPTLAHFVQDSKLGLPINRLLFKDWPAHSIQREHYLRNVSANFENPDVERFKVIDDESGSMIGHLVLTRKRPGGGEGGGGGEGESPAQRKVDVPEYFNKEVFAAVMDTVSELAVDEGVDHLGTPSRLLSNPAVLN